MDDALQLGGNIELSGFTGLEPGNMVILKKIVGNYARKLSEQVEGFERLSLTMKSVHAAENASNLFEINGKVLSKGKAYTSSMTDRNIFFVVDSVLKKIENEIKK